MAAAEGGADLISQLSSWLTTKQCLNKTLSGYAAGCQRHYCVVYSVVLITAATKISTSPLSIDITLRVP